MRKSHLRYYALTMLIIVLVPACICGRNSLWSAQGIVLDEKTGKPIPSAKITFHKIEVLATEVDSEFADREYRTSASGRFRAFFKASNYVSEIAVSVEHPQYQTKKLQLARKQKAVIRLSPK